MPHIRRRYLPRGPEAGFSTVLMIGASEIMDAAGEAGIYEMALGDALEKIFGRGVHDLPRVTDSLNEMGIKTPQGEDWTEENYPEIMEGLGR